MKSILDKDFVYTPSHLTNIRERFERIKKAAPRENSLPKATVCSAQEIGTATPAVSAPISLDEQRRQLRDMSAKFRARNK